MLCQASGPISTMLSRKVITVKGIEAAREKAEEASMLLAQLEVALLEMHPRRGT